MRAIILSAFAVAALSVACGGSEPPPATPSNTTAAPASDKAAFAGAEASGKGEAATGHSDGKGGQGEHGKMPPALHEFHEALAPIWHTTAGAERIAKTCGGEKSLRDKAAAVGDAELTANADAVKAACEKSSKTEVEAKLSSMHDRFHKLVEQAKDKQ